jgi:heme A synthase
MDVFRNYFNQMSSRSFAMGSVVVSFLGGMWIDDCIWRLEEPRLNHYSWTFSFLLALVMLGAGILDAVFLVRRTGSAELQKD